MTITADVLAAGRGATALSDLLGQAVADRGETRVRCPFGSHHRNDDAHPSADANGPKGLVFCHTAGSGWDVAQLVVELGHAADLPGARRWLEDRGHLPRSAPTAGVNGHERLAPTWPFYPEMAERLGWRLQRRSDVECFVLPVVDAGGECCAIKIRGPRVDGRLVARLEANRAGRREPGLIVSPGWNDAAEDSLALLVAGETDLLALLHHAAREEQDVVAATHSNGESAGLDGLVGAFTARRVAVVYDADAAGRKGAAARVAELQAAGVAAVDLPPPAGAKDLREALEGGATVRDLLDAADRALSALDAPAPIHQAGAVADAADLVSFAQTDLGNAERLLARYGFGLRMVPEWGGWAVYDADLGAWRRDSARVVLHLVGETLRAAQAAALEVRDAEQRQALLRFLLRSEAAPRVRAAEELARCAPSHVLPSGAFDADPYLLNAANGIVDLRSGELRPHTPAALCSRRCPHPYVPDAAAPRWVRFLDEITMGRAELVGFLRRAAGYSLIGEVSEHVLLVLHGRGANGKSVLLDALHGAVGTYGVRAEAATFLSRRDDTKPRNDIARLAGARLVSAEEPGERRRLDEAMVKAITGGSAVAARYLYCEPFEFRPAFTLWLATNHRPEIVGTDDGIWRRLKLVPFDAQFTGDAQDRDLPARLREESVGILAWAVAGAREYLERGLDEPDVVRAATREYREESDVVAAFVADVFDVGDGLQVTSSALRDAAATWGKANGEAVPVGKALATRLRAAGFASYRTAAGRGWSGLALRGELLEQWRA